MINTAAYSFASQAYPDKVDKMASVMEGVVGIGMTISPIMGVFIYNVVGFSATFYIFGTAMFPCAFLMLCLPDPKDVKNGNL
jgi:MFS family permease